MSQDRLLVSAASLYADHLGAGIAQQLSGIQMGGIGGPKMKACGVDCWFAPQDVERRNLAQSLRHAVQRQATAYWFDRYAKAWGAPVFLAIDGHGFNLKLARKLRQSNVETIQAVSPPLWTWTPSLFRLMQQGVKRMLCLFPFETQFYDGSGIQAEYVGHPLADTINPASHQDPRLSEKLGLGSTEKPLVAFLIKASSLAHRRYLNKFFEAASLLAKDAQVCVALDEPLSDRQIGRIAAFGPAIDAGVLVYSAQTWPSRDVQPLSHAVLQACTVAVVSDASGSLEAMIFNKPMVYVSPMSARIIKSIHRYAPVKSLSIPNLMDPSAPVTELIGASGPFIADRVKKLLDDSKQLWQMKESFIASRGELARQAERKIADRVRESIARCS